MKVTNSATQQTPTDSENSPTELPGPFQRFGAHVYTLILSVPVHLKIAGLVLFPVIVLGLSLNYWVASGLKDWLSYLLTDVRVDAAMRAGQHSVQLVTVLGAVGSLLVAYLLTFILTRPLLALRDTRGLFKLVAEQGSDRLLGVHILATEAGDVIQTAPTSPRSKG